VRSRVEWGGGALLDVGCYPITLSRWLFGAEPEAVVGQLERDPEFGVDRLGSALLRFPGGQATFTCSTQLVPFQRMQIYGTRGRVEVEIPFNAPLDRECVIRLDDGSRYAGDAAETIRFPAVDQYMLQGDRFAEAVLGTGAVPVSLEDALANMAVIDAVFRSAESGRWERP
jgi:predicted dehydrogenase